MTTILDDKGLYMEGRRSAKLKASRDGARNDAWRAGYDSVVDGVADDVAELAFGSWRRMSALPAGTGQRFTMDANGDTWA